MSAQNYEVDHNPQHMAQAWEVYTRVWRKLRVEVPLLTQLELSTHSPRLATASKLQIAVPGHFRSGLHRARMASPGAKVTSAIIELRGQNW